jgi:acyl-CoA thioesterase I
MRSILLAVLFAFCGTALAAPAILVFGDSLSAAYGIPRSAGWVALLDARLKQRRANYTVTNASISGETSAGGKARIAAELARSKPAVVIVELGANDGLRGLPVAQMKENLTAVVRAAQRGKAKVLLVGMRLPPNYGRPYIDEFRQVFQEIAREQKTGLVPFLFEGMADKPNLFQADNLHPVAEAQTILLENVWGGLAPLLVKPAGR